MIYPEFLKNASYIGVTAPSDGVVDKKDIYRLEKAKENLEKVGFHIIETDNVRKSAMGRSSSSKDRASQLEKLYKDKNIDLISCVGGGDFLIEMLPKLDFDIISQNVKWIQGYSDPTSLLYSITTNLDIATIYGYNFKTFGMKKWHKSLKNNISFWMGKNIIQQNFSRYEKEGLEKIKGDECFNLTHRSCLKILNKDDHKDITGRIIGGCLDVLDNIVGTKYDGMPKFMEKYKKDGIIWYFDNCELSSEQVIRAMWKIKKMGYFKYANAIIFGRSMTNKSSYNISFKDAMVQSLSEIKVPIIYDADIGHVMPQITVINGAFAKIRYKEKDGKITKCYIEYQFI